MQTHPPTPSFPDAASLSALRAWYAGIGSREAIERYYSQALEGTRRRTVSARRDRRHSPATRWFCPQPSSRGSGADFSVRGRRAHASPQGRDSGAGHPADACGPATAGERSDRCLVAASRHPVTASARHPDAGRSDRPDSPSPSLVAHDSRPRHAKCTSYRSLLCCSPGTDRAGPRTDRGGGTGTRNAMGRYPRAAQRRRLTRGLPRAEADVCARGR
jgi:hypothetical protein